VATLWLEAIGAATYGGLTTAGWVQQVTETSNTNVQILGFTGKFSDVGAGPWSVSQSAGSKCRFKASAYAGVDQTNVLDGTPTHSQVNSASTASVSVTSTLAASWLVYDAVGIHAFGSAQTATTSDGSDTVVDVHGSTSASGSDFVGLAADSRRDLSAGTQTRTVTFSSGTQTHVAQAAMMLRAAATAIAPTGIATTAALGGPSLADGSMTVAPSGIAKTAALGSPALTDGSMAITPSGRSVSASLGSPAVVDGSLAITPTGRAVSAALGAPALADESMVIAPTGIAATIALGTPGLGQSLDIAPTGVAASAALGNPALSDGSMAVTPTGRSVAVALGSPSVVDESLAVSLAGLPVTAALGAPTVSPTLTAEPAGIAVGAALGTPSVTGSVTAAPDGIAVTVGLGSPTVDGDLPIEPSGIATAVTLGAIGLTQIPAGPPGCGGASLTSPTSSVGLLTRRSGVSLVERSAVLDR
jgi:hypothetical protein